MWNRPDSPVATNAVETRRYVPVLEQLEVRTAPAANVIAVVSGEDLILTGDDEGAEISISQPGRGQFTVVGVGETTINGSAGPVTFSKVTRDLRINLGAGNDAVEFDQTQTLTVRGNLSVSGGAGGNTVRSSPGPGSLKIRGNLSIANLAGPTQTTSLRNLKVSGHAEIFNQGDDVAVSIELGSSKNTIRGNLLINNGEGDIAATTLDSVHVKGNVTILNAAENVFVSIGEFSIGEFDEVPPVLSTMRNLLIAIGTGETASTSLVSAQVKGDVQILNQADVAATSLSNLRIRSNLQVMHGDGQLAEVTISQTRIGQHLHVVGGEREDSTIYFSGKVARSTSLIGGGVGGVLVGEATFGGSFHVQTGDGPSGLLIGTIGEASRLVPVVKDVPQEGGGVEKVIEYVTVKYLVDGSPVIFKDRVTVDLGNGDDALRLALTAKVTFGKTATFDGQDDDNTASVNIANLPAFPVLHNFDLTPSVSSAASEDDVSYSVDLLNGIDAGKRRLTVVDLQHVSGDQSGITNSGNRLNVNPSAYNHLPAGLNETIIYRYRVIDGNGGGIDQLAEITIIGEDEST